MDYTKLSKRESQIMDIIHRLGEASVADVMERLPDPPGYNAVRRLINILEEKGHLKHYQKKNKYIYSATVKKEAAKRSILDHIVKNFFGGSGSQVVSTLLNDQKITEKELDEIAGMIEEAKKRRKYGDDK